jgi:hypothetical protein
MKAISLFSVGCFLFCACQTMGQTAYKLELDRAHQEYETAVKQALAPIDRRYAETLQQLLQRATAAGDLETVTKVKEILDQKSDAGIATRLAGSRWSFPVKNTPREQQWIEFSDDGMLGVGWSPTKRVWKFTAGDKVEIQPYSEAKYKMIIDFNGGLRKATIVEGELKGQTMERLK